MTLVIGVKYKEGIILGSDSQATLNRGVPLKKLNQVKLFELKDTKNKIVIGGAGAVPFISKAIEEIQNEVSKNENLSFHEIVSIAEMSVLHVARWYCFDRVREMVPKISEKQDRGQVKIIPQQDFEKETKRDVTKKDIPAQQLEIKPVDVILIIAGIDENNESQIYIVYSDGVSEKQQNEAAIGSGAAYAEYILSQLTSKDMKEEAVLKVVNHAINEVGKIDPGVGGMPQLVKIDIHGVHEYDEPKVTNLLGQVEGIQQYYISMWGKYLDGELKFEDKTKSKKIVEEKKFPWE